MRILTLSQRQMQVLTWSLLGSVFMLGLFMRMQPVKTVFSPVLASRIIVLDPGHGGPDPGTVSSLGLEEKTITLQIAEKVERLLITSGAAVINLRHDGGDLAGDEFTGSIAARKSRDLQNRVKIANEHKADLFISIHVNADPSPRWSGAQTFYRAGSGEGQKLAEAIQQEFKTGLKNTKREAKAGGEYYVLEQTDMTAVIVEVGFLSNPNEAKLLSDEKYQWEIAECIYLGLTGYYAAGLTVNS